MTKKIIYPKNIQRDVIKLYLDKTTLENISKKLEISVWGVKTILKENNIKKRNLQENRIKYDFNSHYFDIINSEEKAYWLGFIYADGFVNTKNDLVGITLSEKDINHLEKFKKCINSNHPINIFNVSNKYKSCRLAFVNSHFKKNLISKGVLLKKSLILEFPTKEQVPDKYIFDFIRGYFDGDGSIGYDSNRNRFVINLLGTESFLKEILSIYKLNYNYSINSYNNKDTDVKYISILSKANNEIFLDMLYKNANIYLERKYNKYIKFKESL